MGRLLLPNEPATSTDLLGSGPLPLAARLEAAQRLLRRCGMCELHCNVDRGSGERGRCGLSDASLVYKTYLSGNEEAELWPALRVFLGGCNLRCQFCDEAPDAFRTDLGRRVTPAQLGAELSQAVQRGVKTISLLGGEPTIHAHTILALAAAAPRRLPLALNTNMYTTPIVLDLLDGVVDWYLADFKFGNDACARRIADIPNYTAIVRRNLRLATARANVIVRHVLLPGHLECCFRPIVDWLDESLPGTRFQLYPGYVPCGVGGDDPVLGRLNTPDEVRAAEAYLRKTSLRTAAASPHADPPGAPASAAGAGDVTITLGVDGHVYCHDLAPEVSAALAALRRDAGRVEASQATRAIGEETA